MNPFPPEKAAILNTIRRGLRRGPLPSDQAAMLEARLAAHPRHTIPARARLPRAERIAAFSARLQKEFGTVTEVSAEADAPSAIARYLLSHNMPAAVTIAPHPALRAMPWAESGLAAAAGRAYGPEIATVQYGYAGIAETGTLMLPSGPHRPVTLNLLPEAAIVILPVSRIVGAYEDAWDLLRAEISGMPRSVMLITGPSRTADIEQHLELGAHGPRALHVVLLTGAETETHG